MKVNYSGKFPPQETGFATSAGTGNIILKYIGCMRHSFTSLTEPSCSKTDCNGIKDFTPSTADAQGSGFEGARWPKVAGPDGRPTPGTINPFIIWNHPNPIYLSELVYRAQPNAATLESTKTWYLNLQNFWHPMPFTMPKPIVTFLGLPLKV